MRSKMVVDFLAPMTNAGRGLSVRALGTVLALIVGLALSSLATARIAELSGVWVAKNNEGRVTIITEMGRTSFTLWVRNSAGEFRRVSYGSYLFDGRQLTFKEAHKNERHTIKASVRGETMRWQPPGQNGTTFERVGDFGKGLGERLATGKVRPPSDDVYSRTFSKIYRDWGERAYEGDQLAEACSAGDRQACHRFDAHLEEQWRWTRGMGTVVKGLRQEADRLERQNVRRQAQLKRRTADQIARERTYASQYLQQAQTAAKQGYYERAAQLANQAAIHQQNAANLSGQ